MIIVIASALQPSISQACDYNLCSQISFGQHILQALTLKSEIHAFSFAATTGEVAIVRAYPYPETSLNPRLELYNAAGNLIASAGIPNTGRAEILSEPLAGGGYTILIRDIDGVGRGGYSIYMESARGLIQSTEITYGQNVHGSLDELYSADGYRFYGNAGEVISLQMTEVGGDFEPRLELFSPNGERLRDIAGDSQAAIQDYSLPHTGWYSVLAGDIRADQTGEYILTLDLLATDVDSDQAYGLPRSFALYQNLPNPFNPNTAISFYLPRTSPVAVEIFNVTGTMIKTVASSTFPAGRHTVYWDGRDKSGISTASGIYLYRIITPDVSLTHKMLLLK